MASLYDLQTATIDANGGIIPHESEIFQHIRAALKLHWEDIVALLNKCRSFGCDVERLRARHSSATDRNIIKFLKDMSSTCKECTIAVKILRVNHEKVILPYRKHENDFKNQLEYPRVLLPEYQSFKESSHGRKVRTGSSTQAGGRWISLSESGYLKASAHENQLLSRYESTDERTPSREPQ